MRELLSHAEDVVNVLSESDWARVLRIRIKSKRGEGITDEERTLITAAYKSDPNRYKSFEREVFRDHPTGGFVDEVERAMSRFDVPERTEEQRAQARVVETFARLIDRVVGRERGARFEWSYAIRESFSEDAKVVTIVLEEHGGRTLEWNLWVTDREIMRELRSTGKYVLADRTIEAANALAWRFYEPSFRIGRRLRGQRR